MYLLCFAGNTVELKVSSNLASVSSSIATVPHANDSHKVHVYMILYILELFIIIIRSSIIRYYMNYDLILPIQIWHHICMILPVHSFTFEIITRKAIFLECTGVVGLHRKRDWTMFQKLWETLQHVNVKVFQNT